MVATKTPSLLLPASHVRAISMIRTLLESPRASWQAKHGVLHTILTFSRCLKGSQKQSDASRRPQLMISARSVSPQILRPVEKRCFLEHSCLSWVGFQLPG